MTRWDEAWTAFIVARQNVRAIEAAGDMRDALVDPVADALFGSVRDLVAIPAPSWSAFAQKLEASQLEPGELLDGTLPHLLADAQRLAAKPTWPPGGMTEQRAQPSNEHDAVAAFVLDLFEQLGGRLWISDRSISMSMPEAALYRLRGSPLPQLDGAEPHELFHHEGEWRGALKCAAYSVARLIRAGRVGCEDVG